jgi:hypothetical protein
LYFFHCYIGVIKIPTRTDENFYFRGDILNIILTLGVFSFLVDHRDFKIKQKIITKIKEIPVKKGIPFSIEGNYSFPVIDLNVVFTKKIFFQQLLTYKVLLFLIVFLVVILTKKSYFFVEVFFCYAVGKLGEKIAK